MIDRSDHVGNLMMMKVITQYHDILQEPECEPDVNDTVIHNLRRMFNDLKREQTIACHMIGDLPFQMKESVRIATEVQLDMNEIHRELKQLSEEMKAFNEILMYTSGASLEHLHGVE